MEGARKLLREGKIPSVADAAEVARVSRATAYRYFPTQSALIQEAVHTGLPNYVGARQAARRFDGVRRPS